MSDRRQHREREGTEEDRSAAGAGEAEAGGAREAGDPAEAAGSGEAAAEPWEDERISEEVRKELEELDALRDRHLRLAAEFDNYRRRTRQELTKTRETAQADLVGRLLDALDDLERVSSMPAESTTVEALHEGVELVDRKIRKQLAEAGLERIEAEDGPFDPQVHEALVTVPTPDAELDDTVSRVLVQGYRFGDRLVRPARVEVRKYDPEAAELSD